MRKIVMLLLLSLPGAAFSSSSGVAAMEKIKTGILPSGHFYSIYEVVCQDRSVASIASTERGRRWCTAHEGELSCFSRMNDATGVACASDGLVANELYLGVSQPNQ